MNSCAYHHLSESGHETIIGFPVLITKPIKRPDSNNHAHGTTVSNFGVLLFHSPISSGISVGLNKESSLSISGDAVIYKNSINHGDENETK